MVLKVHSAVEDKDSQSRFDREVRIAARIMHPNLARVYTTGRHGGRDVYYAMESVRGVSLDHFWARFRGFGRREGVDPGQWRRTYEEAVEEAAKAEIPRDSAKSSATPDRAGDGEAGDSTTIVRQSPLPDAPAASPAVYFGRVADLTRQLAEAAHALHQNGVVHRDIKPANVIVTAGGTRAVLVDLGSAKEPGPSDLTKDREFIGTPRYASPEQSTNPRTVAPRSDVYAIGVILWEWLTLEPAFATSDADQVMQQVVTKLLPVPHTLRPDVPRTSRPSRCPCVQKDPDDRYPSARELADELRRFLDGSGVRAHRATWWFRARRWSRYHQKPLRIAILVAACVGVLFAVLVSYLGYQNWRLGLIEEERRQEDTVLRAGLFRHVNALTQAAPRFDLSPPHPVQEVDRADPALNPVDFHILEDRRVVDLRGWKPDGSGGVTMSRRLRVVKRRQVDKLILYGRTSADELIHRCVQPNPQTARLVHVRLPIKVGTKPMKERQIHVDVRDIEVNSEFDIVIMSTYRGACRDPEECGSGWTVMRGQSRYP